MESLAYARRRLLRSEVGKLRKKSPVLLPLRVSTGSPSTSGCEQLPFQTSALKPVKAWVRKRLLPSLSRPQLRGRQRSQLEVPASFNSVGVITSGPRVYSHRRNFSADQAVSKLEIYVPKLRLNP